jgi:ribosome recycling factor
VVAEGFCPPDQPKQLGIRHGGTIRGSFVTNRGFFMTRVGHLSLVGPAWDNHDGTTGVWWCPETRKNRAAGWQGNAMTTQEILKDAETRMEKALEVFRNDLKGLRTGRASPHLLDALRVEYYGSPTPIKNIASITCPDAATIVIKPYQAETLKDIEKAIRASDLGLAPNNDGKVIRLSLPPMSGDQRKKLVQQIKKQAEAAKVACRNIRRDSNKHFDDAEKNKLMTEDERDRGKAKIQDLLKSYEAKIDELAAKKEKEVMEE